MVADGELPGVRAKERRAMMLQVRAGVPLPGRSLYVASEDVLLFAPDRSVDVAGAVGRDIAIVSVGALQLRVRVSSRRVLYVAGHAPRGAWAAARLPEPTSVPGVVEVAPDVTLERGRITRLSLSGEWRTEYDESNGWIRVARDDEADEFRTAVASGTVIGCSRGRLQSIWVRPHIVEGAVGGDVPSPDAPYDEIEVPALSRSWDHLHDVAPMPWSLGIVGDVTWNAFPQLRPLIRDRLLHKIDGAIMSGRLPFVLYNDDRPSDDQLSRPDNDEYVTFIVRPHLLNDLNNGVAAYDPTRQLCRFLRLLLSYAGEDEPVVSLYAEDVIETLATAEGVAAVAAHDPELAAHIREQFRMWRAHGPQ